MGFSLNPVALVCFNTNTWLQLKAGSNFSPFFFFAYRCNPADLEFMVLFAVEQRILDLQSAWLSPSSCKENEYICLLQMKSEDVV